MFTGLAVLGAYSVLEKVYSLMGFLNRQLLRSSPKFFARYGKEDSWIVVTGGSDGIGLEICW